MASRFRNISTRLSRVLISVLVVIGLAGLPAAAAADLGCITDYSIHQSAAPEMACCASKKACSSAAAAAADKHQHFEGAPDAACDELICFDSSAEHIALSPAGSSSIEGGAAALSAGKTVDLSVPDLNVNVCSDFFRRVEPPPIYKRVCVYLI